jgi:hypothetical protein
VPQIRVAPNIQITTKTVRTATDAAGSPRGKRTLESAPNSTTPAGATKSRTEAG